MLSSSQDTCVDTVTYRVRPGSHECAIATFAIKIYQRRLRGFDALMLFRVQTLLAMYPRRLVIFWLIA